MKTHTGHYQQHRNIRDLAESRLVPVMVDSFRETLALLGAVTTAISIVMFSVWIAGTEMQSTYSALTWGLGFIFLAMAVDNRMSTAALQLMTGVALLVLAWLQSAVSVDFTIVTGLLVALWAAAALFRQLR